MLRERPCHPILLARLLSVVGIFGMLACQPARGPETADSANESGPATKKNDALSGSQGEGSKGPASASSEASTPQASPRPEDQIALLEDGREPEPQKSLPKLSFSHLGMHIGGESNSPESKRPWLEGIDAGEERLLLCYRLVNEPESGGSYGVDLYVGKNGGAPEVRGSRQKIGGEEFDACMKQAFEHLNFKKPERPTVLSYSLLFAWDAK
jgi:hypothetical protein